MRTANFKVEFPYFWSDNIISVTEFEFPLISARAVSWRFHSWRYGALWNLNTTQIIPRSSVDTLAPGPRRAPRRGHCWARRTGWLGTSTWAALKPLAEVWTPSKTMPQEETRSRKLLQRLDLHDCGRQPMEVQTAFHCMAERKGHWEEYRFWQGVALNHFALVSPQIWA